MKKIIATGLFLGLFIWLTWGILNQPAYLLHVSFDPTRELFQDVNQSFTQNYALSHHEKIEIRQSHAGSGKQARSVIEGLPADIVSLALAGDIDAIAKSGRLPKDWQNQLPHHSCAYTSVIVFLVRKGNPKQIKTWDDLGKANVEVVTPNPKTSGGARWNFLAAWGAELASGKNDIEARIAVEKIYGNVQVLDPGARAAIATFIKRRGDALITWESDARLAAQENPQAGLEIIYPPITILAEPSLALVNQNAERRQHKKLAEDYLQYLYTPEAQSLIAKHSFRPVNDSIARLFKEQFPVIKTFTLDQYFGNWTLAQKRFFAEGGVFDSIPLGVNHSSSKSLNTKI